MSDPSRRDVMSVPWPATCERVASSWSRAGRHGATSDHASLSVATRCRNATALLHLQTAPRPYRMEVSVWLMDGSQPMAHYGRAAGARRSVARQFGQEDPRNGMDGWRSGRGVRCDGWSVGLEGRERYG